LQNNKVLQMKKLLTTIMGVFVVYLSANAQVTFSPGTFTADDQVTLTVDVSGTPLAGQSEAYIWIWANPSGVGPAPNGSVNGDWGNSSAAAKLTAAGTNKWSFTFTGTTLFGLTPGELHDFGFLVKAKDGSKQTSDFKPFKFDPLTFTPNKLRVFPSKVGRDDVITVFFEQTLGTSLEEQRMKPVSATITMYDETNTAVGSALTVNVRKVADNIWAASFIPSASFTPGVGHKLTRFTYHFNGTTLSTTGSTQSAATANASVDFTEMK
jgi:hypothetical protein